MALVVLIVVIVNFCTNTEVHTGPGVSAPADPIQERIDRVSYIPFGKYTLVPLARFQIVARVLSRHTYRFDRESDLSPVDLALGWGRMSDESVLKHIEISQSGRWYHWRTQNPPIPLREIETHSANMHIIPADKIVEKRLRRLRTGETVKIDGFLVRVFAPDGWRWVSSLSRLDTGGGACEIVYAQDLSIVDAGR
jgi:hypothetical protein